MTTSLDQRPTTTSDLPASAPPTRHRRHVLRTVAIVVAVLLVPVGWSYGRYLTAPGNEPVTVRSSDWLRDHGFDSAVNAVEQWWYTRDKPSGSHPPAGDVPTTVVPNAVGIDRAVTAAAIPENGEGIWAPVTGLASTPGSVAETFIRPDRAAPSVSATLVRFDQRHLRTVLVPGTKEPGGTWAWRSEIPADQRPQAVAAFNAGFKFAGTPGGMYTEGRHAVRPLQNGLASLVIHRDGHADVAMWGRDATLDADVVSVRQNLDLIVDGGRPVAGLTSDLGGHWGTKKSQFQYTWRSAVGVDGQGRLIYAAGSRMTLTQLAAAMVDAGAVRAMQLDIHDGVVTFNWYRPAPGTALGVAAQKLTPSMQRTATRYLTPDSRDFIAVEAK